MIVPVARREQVLWKYLFSAEGADLPLPALRDTAGVSCWPLAWMAWCESIGISSSIIDLLSDRCSSPHRRHAGRCQHASGEGADLTLTELTRFGQHSCWYDAAPVVRGVGLHYCSAPAAQECSHRAALVVSSMFVVLCTVGQELAASMLLVAGMSKSDRHLLVCCVRSSVRSV